MEYEESDNKSTAAAFESADSGRPVAEQVLAAIRRMSRALDVHSRALMHRWGLTGPQLMVLGELTRRSEMSTGELAEAVSLGQATVTGILDRLERHGLVVRERSVVDKRRVMVRPTQACRERLEAGPPVLQETFARQFNELADWEQMQILASLQRLVAMMQTPGRGSERKPADSDPRNGASSHARMDPLSIDMLRWSEAGGSAAPKTGEGKASEH